MKGALMQLVFIGAEDIHLSGPDGFTKFKAVYKKHTNFSMENIELFFINKPQFGSTSTVKIPKKGDLISKMYLKLDLPYNIDGYDVYWVNRIGFRLLKKIELYIGDQLVDRQYGQWMHIWTEISHTVDKKNTLNNLVGTKGLNGLNNGLNVKNNKTLYIPLYFFFNNHYGQSLPVHALNVKDIYLKFYFETKSKCINSGSVLLGDLSNVSLLVDYIFLEKEENLKYVQNKITYIYETIHHYNRNLVSTGLKTIILPFNLPTKELYWVVSPLTQSGNYDKFTNFTDNGVNNITNVQFKIDGKNIFSSKARKYNYFNYVLPYQYHKVKPDLGINLLPFFKPPDNTNINGYINLRDINKFSIILNCKGPSFFDIYSRSYNILEIENGIANVIYKF